MNFELISEFAVNKVSSMTGPGNMTLPEIYYRPHDYRMDSSDILHILYATIERCLTTQLTDGTFLVSPIIFNKDMTSTVENISFEPISKWVDREFTISGMTELSGYVDNLMDWYPQNLILQAIDDAIWKLNSCLADIHPVWETMSIFGNVKDAPPYFENFRDATAVMDAAGVQHHPISNEMVLVPARANGGDILYGPPSSATRIYPEMLIARWKVLQAMYIIQSPPTDARTWGRTENYSTTWWDIDPPLGPNNTGEYGKHMAGQEECSDEMKSRFTNVVLDDYGPAGMWSRYESKLHHTTQLVGWGWWPFGPIPTQAYDTMELEVLRVQFGVFRSSYPAMRWTHMMMSSDAESDVLWVFLGLEWVLFPAGLSDAWNYFNAPVYWDWSEGTNCKYIPVGRAHPPDPYPTYNQDRNVSVYWPIDRCKYEFCKHPWFPARNEIGSDIRSILTWKP